MLNMLPMQDIHTSLVTKPFLASPRRRSRSACFGMRGLDGMNRRKHVFSLYLRLREFWEFCGGVIPNGW
jgi:hypothetical protein